MHKKEQRKINYCNQEQYWQNKYSEENNKNRKKKREEKQLHRCFNRQTEKIILEKIWAWLRKEHLKKETESLLISAQNNALRTNCIKAKIDDTQRNCEYRFRDGMINHIVSECNKLAQKSTKHDWVGKGIH